MSPADTVGFIGGALFAISAIPMAIHALKTKKVDVPWSTIGLVAGGAGCMLVYGGMIKAVPLIVDMTITFTCWATMAYVKVIQKERV